MDFGAILTEVETPCIPLPLVPRGLSMLNSFPMGPGGLWKDWLCHAYSGKESSFRGRVGLTMAIRLPGDPMEPVVQAALVPSKPREPYEPSDLEGMSKSPVGPSSLKVTLQ